MPSIFDCVVIGGGAIGWAVAYELSSQGLRVALLNKAQVQHQASWAAAGIIPPADMNNAHDAWQQLVALGHQLHPIWAERLLRETGIDVEYVESGAIHFARTPGEAASLRAACHQWSRDGVRCNSLEPDRLEAIQPGFSQLVASADMFHAVWLPHEAQVRPPRYLRALQTACRSRGVEIFDDREALSWQFQGGHVSAIVTSQGELSAGTYCVTLGAWTGKLLKQLGVHLETKPWRGQMVLLVPQDHVKRLKVILNEGPNYLVPRRDGRVLAGSTVEETGFKLGNTPEAVEGLVAFATQILPAVDFDVEATWSALRPGTGDGFPFIGPVPGVDNVLAATGHFRSGIALSPATATVLRQHLLGQPLTISLNPFRLDRE